MMENGPMMPAWETLSRMERDRAYDNAAAVSDSAALIAARIEAAAAFRAATPGHLDLAYGPGERNRWDLFPADDPDAPCLVFIHGGYWQRNRREDFACLAAGVRAHGWSAALPGYTLAPVATLTQITAEIHAALDWLAANGPSRGIAGPILLSGWSAGAHLAALALSHPAVAAGLALSGVYELGPIRDTGLDTLLRLSDDEVAALSPRRLPPVPKPLAIAYGTRELPRLVEDSRALHQRRAAAHVPGPLIPIAGADHFTILDALACPDGELTQVARALMH